MTGPEEYSAGGKLCGSMGSKFIDGTPGMGSKFMNGPLGIGSRADGGGGGTSPG